MFYNGDRERVLANILAFIDTITEELEVYKVMIEVGSVRSAIGGLLVDFPHKDGVEKASPFKLASNFLCNFVAVRPIRSPFPASAVGATIAGIENHQNALVAFQLACMALEGATIERGDGSKVVVSNPIWVSSHSYCDIIDALSAATPATHFKMVSVLLEQLVYKTNPHGQYEE